MSGRTKLVLVVVVVVLLVLLGVWGMWLWVDHDMRHPQESGWMD
ncbi:hypothetical protein OU416_39355 [Saccharopolyspora indica]|nr:hypothetical protein [Saccharopolyspora indica]MDA3650173.1 hypothetical protein [Saccharopolyspora indica]